MNRSDGIATIKRLHQYYRDCLSQPRDFPDIGKYPPELIEWVIDKRNTDVSQLAEYLETFPGSELPREHDLALRLMLFTIVQANLASDYNNRFPDYTLPPGIVANIKRSLGRVLELHPTGPYIAVCVQLLYRINEIEEVIALSQDYVEIFAKYPVLQAIVGFVHTMLGDYATALNYLKPLAMNPAHQGIPLVGLSYMTCLHFQGLVPQWPLNFDSFKTNTADLARLIDRLPRLDMIEPLAGTPRPVVFVACDTVYFFEHALALAYSIHATNADKLNLHFHLYSPTPDVLVAIKQLRERLPGMSIGVSAEHGPYPMAHAPSYYATARFARAYQIMGAYQCELCILDADALFNGSWDAFTAGLAPETELVLARMQDAPFWERVLAGFIYCKPTPLAEQFLARVAQFILHNMELGQVIWFTDQVALSGCDDLFTAANPAVYHIDSRRVIDLQHTPDSLCWMVTTMKTGNPRYDAAREHLAKRYSSIAQ